MMDGPAEKGGENQGARPMEMFLLGIGGCSSFDVTQMLQKGRQQISDCEVEVVAERADSIPAVFTKIHLNFKIKGENIDEHKVARAIQLSAEKYCSASIMMQAAGVDVTHSYEILSPNEVTEKSENSDDQIEKPPEGLQGLHHIALFVKDLEACVHFYVDILGMNIEWQPDADNVYLCSGKDNFALHRAQHDLAPSAGQKLDHIGFIISRVEYINKWCEYLRSKGVVIQNEPRTHRDGATSFYALDPEGNLVQFIHHPPISEG